MEQTYDKGFIVGGALGSWYPNGNKFSSGWVAKLDSSGNKEWGRTFMGNYGYVIYGIAQRRDSTFIAGGLKAKDATGGISSKLNGVARKYDQDGKLLWEKEYPPGRTSTHDKTDGYVRYMEQGKDGELIFTGFKSLNPITNSDSVREGWIFKTEKDGDLLWMRSFRYHELGEHRLWTVREVEKKRVLAVGTSTHPDTTYGRESPWILKLDSMGCVSSGCAVGVRDRQKKLTSGFRVFPNPNDGTFSIRSERQKGPYKGTLRIFDQKGKTLIQREMEGHYPFEERVSLPEVDPGTYFVEWEDENGRYVRKVVLE